MNFRDIAPEIAAIAKKYDYKTPPPILLLIQEWIEKVLRWISDFLALFKIHIPGLADTPMVGNFMQVLIFLVGAASLGAILYFVWKRMGELRAQSDRARRGHYSAQLNLDASGWKLEADQLAQAAQWKEACRAIYMSCLRLLSECAIIDFGPTRTNFEYYYALSARSSYIARTFKDLANAIELIWFGNRAAQNSDYLECLALLTSIEQECNAIQAQHKDQAVTAK